MESLPSYLYRVAFDHGFSVGELVHSLYRHSQRNELHKNLGTIPHSFSPGELIRGGSLTSTIKCLLEHYSSIDLTPSYLWILERAIGESNGEICRGFRWCPECFHDMDRLNIEPYFKLIWSMKSVSACPIHRSPFLETCSNCSRTQNGFYRNYDVSRCQHCGEKLSKRKTRLKIKDLSSSWDDIGVDIIELFKDMSAVDAKSIKNEGAYLSLKSLFDYYWEKDFGEGLYVTLGRDQILSLVHKQKGMSLLTARRIAFRLGIPLFDFLSGRAKDITLTLDHKSFCQLPPGYLQATKKAKRDYCVVLKKIKRFLDGCERPPTVKDVAQAVDVSKGYLEYRHGPLVSTLVEQRKVYENQLRIEKEYLATREALGFFLGEAYAPNTGAKREAFRVLRERTDLSKNFINLGIERASRVLGI